MPTMTAVRARSLPPSDGQIVRRADELRSRVGLRLLEAVVLDSHDAANRQELARLVRGHANGEAAVDRPERGMDPGCRNLAWIARRMPRSTWTMCRGTLDRAAVLRERPARLRRARRLEAGDAAAVHAPSRSRASRSRSRAARPCGGAAPRRSRDPTRSRLRAVDNLNRLQRRDREAAAVGGPSAARAEPAVAAIELEHDCEERRDRTAVASALAPSTAKQAF